MTSKRAAWLLLGAILSVSQAARAQPGGAPAPSPVSGEPARAEAGAPRLTYRSPFEGYRPHRDITPGPWRAMNDEVARIGGWKAYAREAHEASATPGTKAPAPVAPTASPGPR